MKQLEVEITTDFGFAHYGGAMTDETSSNIEISDRLADYLEDNYERAERCFGDFSPMERCLDWDYEIWSISE